MQIIQSTVQKQATVQQVISEIVSEPSSFDFMKILRILIYLYISLQVLSIIKSQKNKPTAKDRLVKRFNFAHEPILASLDKEGMELLEVTFKNTLGNITIKADEKPKKVRKARGSRVFVIDESSNIYYDHVEYCQEQTKQESKQQTKVIEESKTVVDQNTNGKQQQYQKQCAEEAIEETTDEHLKPQQSNNKSEELVDASSKNQQEVSEPEFIDKSQQSKLHKQEAQNSQSVNDID